MKYVLDASVALKWVFGEEGSDKALQLRAEFVLGVHDILAPDIFAIEVGHALSKAHRQRKISEDEAHAYFIDLLSTPPRLYPSASLLPRAYEFALQSRASLYDCLYLALAEQSGCSLLTADQRLIQNLQSPSSIVHLSQL
ncbi:MAG TPA: type II toxin-antitoxin system VapC family toxin [Pirellulales bacterium]